MGLKVLGAKEADAICQQIAEQLLAETPGERSLKKVAEPAQAAINARTPVRTGNLLSKNGHRMIDDHTLEFYNDASYSKFVHDGTSRMQARPFMRDGLAVIEQLFPGLWVADMNDLIQTAISSNRPKEL